MALFQASAHERMEKQFVYMKEKKTLFIHIRRSTFYIFSYYTIKDVSFEVGAVDRTTTTTKIDFKKHVQLEH